MLVFIGGAARTGKGILARRLLVELAMPYLSLDVLKMGLARGVPSYGIDPNAGGIEVAEKLWPLLRAMSSNMLDTDVHYIIEGEVLPKQVYELQQAHPAAIRACFLGYTSITPDQKLDNIRAYAGHPNDWSSTYTDSALLEVISANIMFSHYLKDECARYDLRYFDTSAHFLPTLDAVAAYLQAE